MDVSVGAINVGSRKKKQNVAASARTLAKNRRYAEKDPDLTNFKRPCNHNSKTLACSSVSKKEILLYRRKFYNTQNKIDQDRMLCHLMVVCPTQRKRPRKDAENGRTKPKHVHVFYYFRTKNNLNTPICKKFLMAALNISKGRIETVAKTLERGDIPKEKRGGDRISRKNIQRKEKVREFIAMLPASESHYNRKKSSRIYLACGLNLRKLFEMYNTQYQDFRVSLTMFKNIFYNEFNIGFKSPASDVCGTCLNLRHAISKQSGQEKVKTMTDLRLHTMRANAFYKLAKQKPLKSISFAFDLQQVHPLPKTPIQDAFYLRQISFYAFCCVNMDSKNPTFFTWDETQANRGSTEVGSALLSYLRSLVITDCETLRLFCDGCGGQNKNSYVVHLLAFWLRETPPSLKNIVIHFSVRGHSFLPADRAFGRVEKLLKKKNIIVNKEEYNELYSQVGHVKSLGKDWCLYDIKSIAKSVYKKLPGIKSFKRLELKKVLVTVQEKKKERATRQTKKTKTLAQKRMTIKYKGSEFYHFESAGTSFQNMVKLGKNENTLHLSEKAIGNNIKQAKKDDVKKLLETQYSNAELNIKWEDLPELKFYKDVIFGTSEEENDVQEPQDETDEETCDCLEPDCAIHV